MAWRAVQGLQAVQHGAQQGVPQRGWRFWIDRGGTFTDVVAADPRGRLQVRKVLSQQPERPGDPAVAAIAELLGCPTGSPIPAGLVQEVRLGTTVATNALLEHHGEPVLLLINRGFADLLQIGDQHRPDIFALAIARPQPLAMRVIEVEGRLAADGRELEPLQLDQALAAQLHQARAEGYSSCAVALLHSALQPSHEQQLGAWLERFGFRTVALSHRLSRQPRLVPRGHTALVEAAVAPVLAAYLDQVRADLGPEPRLRVMRSSGSLAAPALLQAKDTILSGPAGGMVGAVAVAERALASADLPPQPVVGFDMGGTSTDVFHFDPGLGALAWERQPDTEIAGLRLQASMLPIHTVAAGGGSIVRFDGERLRVGPESAGAAPGPAAYRRGGPATITDANLLLGRLPVAALPAVFGPDGDQPADRAAVQQRFTELALAMAPVAPGISPEQVAAGALAIAIETMAGAIRRISIERGHDLREALLVSYGGAGGQHACRLAEALAIRRVLLHPLAGVLSAYGIGQAEQRLLLERSPRLPLTAGTLISLEQQACALLEQGRSDLRAAGDLPPQDPGRLSRRLELRVAGREQGLVVDWPALSPAPVAGAPSTASAVEALPEASAEAMAVALAEAFLVAHQQRYGYRPALSPADLVVERLLLELAPAPLEPPVLPSALAGSGGSAAAAPEGAVEPAAPTTTPVWLGEARGWQPLPLWQREQLRPGQRLQGPALLLDATSTTLLEPDWSGTLQADGALLLEHAPAAAPAAPAGPAASAGTAATPSPAVASTPAPAPAPASESADPESADPAAAVPQAAAPEPADPAAAALEADDPAAVAPEAADPTLLELYNHRFSAVAEQMGVLLQQSARSVNIRERLDFSCAVFDGAGRLVANAPHIPVHLGSMGESVAGLLAAIARAERPPLGPGDVIVSNDPYNGGTHLPDITAITPVFAGQAAPVFYVASRGHHADVGGITPGSMPAFSRCIADEGLLLDNVPLLQAGRWDEAAWRQRLAAGDHPVRNPDQLLADLQAQVAANRLGCQELERLVQRSGLAEVQAYMGHVQANAAAAVRRAITRLRSGQAVVELDDGHRLQVAVTIDPGQGRARIDCSGTSPQHPGNLNAPLAITKAVVLYVFRCLVGEAIPLNAGCFEPLELVVPEGCLLNPRPPAAVVAGNVETSQALANALLLALGVQAGSQGTMNNLSFGDAERQYYETICGGTGAGPGHGGAAAVQSHMTNSRLTDPEVLESRFPVRLERFAIRRDSGGRGRWCGGDGVVRELRFLAPLTLSLLSGSRRVPPPGLAGGEPGACGANALQQADGRWQVLPGCTAVAVPAGSLLRLETPGGGGYGQAPSPASPVPPLG